MDREQLISCSFFIISKLYKYFHVKTLLLCLDLTIMKTYNPCRVYTNGKDFIMAETKSVDYFLDQIGLTFLGVPGGTFAFAYARVSSDEQATEGKTGVPRQLTHIHEKASTEGYYIPREFIYVDDASGFEFQDRPELSKLRRAYMDPERPANAVVIEALDRLSRNADWHQGFLLDEMKQFGIRTVFWKVYSSRIERAVMGAISQDGMEELTATYARGSDPEGQEREGYSEKAGLRIQACRLLMGKKVTRLGRTHTMQSTKTQPRSLSECLKCTLLGHQ